MRVMDLAPVEGDAIRPLRIERNIPFLPLFWLKDSPPPEEYRYDLGRVEVDGRPVERELVARCPGGIPGIFDRKVFLVILFLTDLRKRMGEPVRITTYETAVLLNQDGGGGRISRSIERLFSASYKARACFLAGERPRTAWHGFHLIERVTAAEIGSNGGFMIRVGEDIAKNYRASFYSTVDLNLVLSLASPIAQGLLLYVNAMRKEAVQCTVVVPIDHLRISIPIQARRPSKVRELLRRAAAELEKRGAFIHAEIAGDEFYATVPALPPELADAILSMVAWGIAEPTARQLIDRYGHERIRRQLRWLPQRSPTKSPAGMLIRAIQDDWGSPQGATPEPTPEFRILRIDRHKSKPSVPQATEPVPAMTYERVVAVVSPDQLAQLRARATASWEKITSFQMTPIEPWLKQEVVKLYLAGLTSPSDPPVLPTS